MTDSNERIETDQREAGWWTRMERQMERGGAARTRNPQPGMSELEEIKARAAAPDKVLEWTNPYADEYTTALQESQADVMKLVALVEKIRDDARADADGFQATADRLWEQIRNRDPERNLEDAQRYTAYAAAYRAGVNIIDRTIKEGLTP